MFYSLLCCYCYDERSELYFICLTYVGDLFVLSLLCVLSLFVILFGVLCDIIILSCPRFTACV